MRRSTNFRISRQIQLSKLLRKKKEKTAKTAQEDQRGPETSQEDLRGAEGTQEERRGAEGTQEDPRGPETSQEDRRGAEGTQEDRRGAERTQEDPGGPETAQEDRRGLKEDFALENSASAPPTNIFNRPLPPTPPPPFPLLKAIQQFDVASLRTTRSRDGIGSGTARRPSTLNLPSNEIQLWKSDIARLHPSLPCVSNDGINSDKMKLPNAFLVELAEQQKKFVKGKKNRPVCAPPCPPKPALPLRKPIVTTPPPPPQQVALPAFDTTETRETNDNKTPSISAHSESREPAYLGVDKSPSQEQSLNGSQCGSCSTRYNTPAGT